MPVPDYETLMLPVLRAFASGKESVRDCLPALIAEFEITPDEQAELLPSGTSTVLSSRAHWARTYLSKAGLLASPKRGRHRITKRGEALLSEQPDRIDNAVLRARFADFDAWLASARKTNGTETKSVRAGGDYPHGAERAVSPDERMQLAIPELETALLEELLLLIQSMVPIAFERLVL